MYLCIFPELTCILLKSLRNTLLTALKFFSRPINHSLSRKSELSVLNKCLDAHADWDLHPLHYLYRVEESQWLNFHTFESVWNTTGQYSDIDKHISLEKMHNLMSQEKRDIGQHLVCCLLTFPIFFPPIICLLMLYVSMKEWKSFHSSGYIWTPYLWWALTSLRVT